jgi:hypothetical protein
MASFLRLHPTDNVVVAVAGLSPGDIVTVQVDEAGDYDLWGQLVTGN